MKIYRNLETIQKREQTGRRFSLFGLLILFIGLLASFVPTWYPPEAEAGGTIARFLQNYWVYISFVALPVGFICASIGSFFINRFARRRWPGRKTLERPDEVLERSLKGLDNKYSYFVWSLPANYVVVGPCGVLIFILRSDRGKIIVDGDRWREPFRIGRIFTVFAREGVGNPSREIEEQKEQLRQLLQDADIEDEDMAEEVANVPMEGAAVFLHPQMELEIQSSTLPVLTVDQVKGYVRRSVKENRLRSSTVRHLTEYLESQANVGTVPQEAATK